MRAVEKTPWAERRSALHDAMCAEAATHSGIRAIAELWRSIREADCSLTSIAVEAECGAGFCDVLAEFEMKDEPCALIVEVKTDDERASGGDTVRQLKWYRARLRETRRYKRVYMAVYAEHWDDSFAALCRVEGIALTGDLLPRATGASSGPISSSESNERSPHP